MSLSELTPEKIIQLQKNVHILQYHTTTHTMQHKQKLLHRCHGHLTHKVIDFNSTFSSVVIPKILIKYLLHASHDSLSHVQSHQIIPFPQKTLLLSRHVEENTPIY